MGRKVKSYKRKSPLILVVAVGVLGLLGFLTYRLIDSGSLGSQNASAGSVQEMTLDGYKVTLTPSRSLWKSLTANSKNVPITTWRYTITGKNVGCYNPTVKVRNEAKPAEVIAQKVNTILLVLDLSEQRKECANKKPATFTLSGVFQAYTNSNLRYIVQYSPAAKPVSNPKATTPTFETTTQDFKLSSLQKSNGGWSYTVTGKAGNCYVADVSAGGDEDTGTTGSFSGIYTLRLVKSRNKDCTTTTDLKLTGSVDGRKYTEKTYSFKVRYAENTVLSSSETKPEAKTLISGNIKLEYLYNGDGTWKYTLTGCAFQNVSAPVSKSLPAKVSVSVTCSDVLTDKATVKVGTIIAPEDSVFTLTLNKGG